MKLTITTPVSTKSKKNYYKIVVDFMIGDADGNIASTVWVEADNPYLVRFVEFLERCQNAFPSGRGGGEKYSYKNIEGYKSFVDGSVDDSTEIYLEWGREPYSYEEATLNDFEITYFDENGVEFNVKYES